MIRIKSLTDCEIRWFLVYSIKLYNGDESYIKAIIFIHYIYANQYCLISLSMAYHQNQFGRQWI